MRKSHQALLIAGVIALAIVLMISPHLMRGLANKEEMIGYEAYLHSRIANQGVKLTSFEDPSIVTSRTIRPTLYHSVLHVTQKFIGNSAAAIILPGIIGLVCLLSFLALLLLLKRPLIEISLSLAGFVLTPAFLYISSTSTPHGLALALILLGAVLFMTKRAWAFALVPWLMLLSFDLFHIIGVLAMLLACILLDKKERMHSLVVGGILLAGVFAIRPPFFTTYGRIPYSVFQGMITDFGSQIGFGVFSLILIVIGLMHSWKHKKVFYPLYFLGAFGFIAMISFGGIISVYLAPLAAIFIAKALLEIRRRMWIIPALRSLTALLIICGLLFSTVSYMDRLAASGPDASLVDASLFLKEISSPNDVILTHATYAPIIESVAERRVVIDTFQADPWVKEDVRELFASRSSKKVLQTLSKYDVAYLLIDRDIDESVWRGNNEGLLFVLRDGETFKKVHMVNTMEIWKVLR